MNDIEFLDYCDGMTETEDCGFVPSNIARLLRLAGYEAEAAEWDKAPVAVHRGYHSAVRRHVEEARARMKEHDSLRNKA